jgi:hypothetical protein
MRRHLVALALALAAAQSAAAGPSDLLFNTPHMQSVEPGATLRYGHMRRSEPRLGIGPDFDQTIALAMGQAQAESFTLDADGAPRTFGVNDGVPGNPLLMVFLENALRSVATATGGSPFYLRNRMREALADGLTVEPDGALAMRPFVADANRDKLGAFADMSLRFTLSEQSPGMFVAMRAEAGPADAPVYAEEIRFDAAR